MVGLNTGSWGLTFEIPLGRSPRVRPDLRWLNTDWFDGHWLDWYFRHWLDGSCSRKCPVASDPTFIRVHKILVETADILHIAIIAEPMQVRRKQLIGFGGHIFGSPTIGLPNIIEFLLVAGTQVKIGLPSHVGCVLVGHLLQLELIGGCVAEEAVVGGGRETVHSHC